MEVQSPSVKRHYDITMSRRTRKQQQQQTNEKPIISKGDTNTKKEVSIETSTTHLPHEVKENENNDHKSLKQLIVGEEKEATMKCSNDDHEGGGKGRNSSSLGDHFSEEEKQLKLVRLQQKDNNIQGLKFKKLVRRYAKVLGHMMKAKRDPHLGDAGKKPVFKLST